jgi:hypothetical protein
MTQRAREKRPLAACSGGKKGKFGVKPGLGVTECSSYFANILAAEAVMGLCIEWQIDFVGAGLDPDSIKKLCEA